MFYEIQKAGFVCRAGGICLHAVRLRQGERNEGDADAHHGGKADDSRDGSGGNTYG